MNEERIIYNICEDLIQSAAEANLGRELTEIELKRLPCVFMDSPFLDSIYCALIEAAEEGMKTEGWEDWDQRYKDTSLEEMSV